MGPVQGRNDRDGIDVTGYPRAVDQNAVAFIIAGVFDALSDQSVVDDEIRVRAHASVGSQQQRGNVDVVRSVEPGRQLHSRSGIILSADEGLRATQCAVVIRRVSSSRRLESDADRTFGSEQRRNRRTTANTIRTIQLSCLHPRHECLGVRVDTNVD